MILSDRAIQADQYSIYVFMIHLLCNRIRRYLMRRDGKGNEELIFNFKRDSAGMREVHLSVKGPLAVIFVVVIFGVFGIGGYLWANGNKKPESMQIPAERSFLGLNYRICDTIKEQRFSRSV